MESNVFEKLGIDKTMIDSYIKRIKNGDRLVTVAGRFSSGKSSFINSFINRDKFLEVANVECTPIIVELIKGDKERIIIKYSDGREIEQECSSENIKKYTKLSKDFDKDIVGISIYGDFMGLDDKCHLIDTPGIDTPNELHETITSMIIQKSDIIIYIFNKTIAQSDLDKIEEIKRFTNEIIFVMTHVDEKTDSGFVKMDSEKIEKLIAVSRNEISKVFSNPEILVVSSKLKDINYCMIEEIRACVEFLSKRNNEEKVRIRVKEQLTIIFQEKLKSIKENYELEKVILNKDRKKVEHDYRETKFKIQEVKFDLEDSNLRINELSSGKKREAGKRLESIYSMAAIEFENRILNIDDITDDVLGQAMSFISDFIKSKIEKYIGEVTTSIVDGVYDVNNEILDKLCKDFGEDINVRIQKPNLSDLKIQKDRNQDEINREILVVENEKLIVQQEVEFNKLKVANIEAKMSESMIEVKEIKNRIANKEGYIPVYDQVLDEGYGQNGKIIGNVIGSVADAAMLFLTPVSGALKAADVAKDSVMIGTMAANGISKIFGSDNITDKKNVTAGDKIGKMANAVASIGSKLSVATYSTMIGETVGNLIKPDKIIKMENEENRLIWQNEDNKLRQELASVMTMKNELERSVEESTISILEAVRKEKQLEQEKFNLEERLRKHQESKQREFEIESKGKIKDYYRRELKRILNEECEVSKQCINSLIDECSKSTIVQNKKEFDEKLNSLNEIIGALENDKQAIEENLEEKLMFIKEIENYSDWIEEWIR